MRTNGKHKNIDYTLKAYRPAPIKDNSIMAIHTGLSVTCCGHLIELQRDEHNKVAKIVISVIDGHVVTGLEASAVNAAAELLYRRAQRFLGNNWKIVPLPKLRELPATGSGTPSGVGKP